MDDSRRSSVISSRASTSFLTAWLVRFRIVSPRTPLRGLSCKLLARLEALEDRRLLSSDLIAYPMTSARPLASTTYPTGLTPAQVRQAYGLNDVSFMNGTIVGDGAGQTIAIVVAFDNPYIASDLQVFNRQYGLPDSEFQIIKQTPSIRSDGGWGLETALDVQWAHAIAPAAKILLLEAKSDSLADLMTMVNVARQQPDVSVISMSWGMNEFAGEKSYNNVFTTPAGHQGITFVAASGDDGSWLGASFPAISPNVLGVGGTQLYVSSDGTYLGETAWSGSGGGYSKFQAEPGYQYSAQKSGLRTSPDVSWNAAVASGVSVYSTLSDSGPGGWFSVGGTSAGAPAWAAIIAIADQGRNVHGQGTIAGAQSILYSLPNSSFRDITAGRNGYSAGAGYDVVTGLGTPYADRVIAGLVTAYNAGNGNYAAAASPKRVRRLSKLHARRHDVLADDSGIQTGFTALDSGATFSTNGASTTITITTIQVTTINANQALVVTVVNSHGRLIEAVVVPIPSLDIAAITDGHTIAPITAELVSSLNITPDVQRVGQGDDPQIPTARTSEDVSDESPLPSIRDFFDRRDQERSNRQKADPAQGIPANLAPQDPPAPAPRLEDPTPLSPVVIEETEDIFTGWERGSDLEWSADLVLLDHFAAMNRRDAARNASEQETAEQVDGSRRGCRRGSADPDAGPSPSESQVPRRRAIGSSDERCLQPLPSSARTRSVVRPHPVAARRTEACTFGQALSFALLGWLQASPRPRSERIRKDRFPIYQFYQCKMPENLLSITACFCLKTICPIPPDR